MSKKKKLKDIVYSTNPNYQYKYEDDEETETLPPSQQLLKIHLEKKHRGGKTVNIIKDFIGTEDDLKNLGKLLKSKCGTGGSVKNSEIIIQGDFRIKIIEILTKEGYKTKKVGG
jgi:translation initiation factor 1